MVPPPPELIGEVLLRLPRDEPEHLFRAALVCKPWLRVLCDPGFRSSYRTFHEAPPLLSSRSWQTVGASKGLTLADL